MNVPKALEKAFAGLIRKKAQVKTAIVRPWQTLRFDPAWKKETDMALPAVDIRAAPPAFDENERTMYSLVHLLCHSKAEADTDHSVVSDLFGEVIGVCETLFSEFTNGNTEANSYLAIFKKALQDELGANFNHDSIGLSFGDSAPPFIDSRGINTIGVVLRVHYSRNDI